jgi:hypothetical protein
MGWTTEELSFDLHKQLPHLQNIQTEISGLWNFLLKAYWAEGWDPVHKGKMADAQSWQLISIQCL